jgi:hypothetical protein
VREQIGAPTCSKNFVLQSTERNQIVESLGFSCSLFQPYVQPERLIKKVAVYKRRLEGNQPTRVTG